MATAPIRSKFTSHLAAAVYAAFLIFLIIASTRQGLSHYYSSIAFRSGSDADIAAAVSWEPSNPTAHRIEGEVRMRQKDFAGAALVFERAIPLRERDFLLWLQLGYARQQLGQLDAAAAAFETSISLAPNYSRPQHYMGMLLLDADREEEAFAFLSKAAELDPELAPSVRRLARKSFGDANAIESALRPADAASRRTLARYMIKHGYMTDSIRSFLLSDQLTMSQKNEFIKYLIHKKNYGLAREVWRSRPGMDSSAAGEPVFDGGFEQITESDASGLGWLIEQKMAAMAVARDQGNAHTGKNSLNIRFAGAVELRRPLVSQLEFISPGRSCTLVFYYRSIDIVSAGLPSIVISDAISNETIAVSPPLTDTKGEWARGEVTFTATNDPVVLISLQRPACDASPCPIFGELSLDDLSITIR